MHNRDLRFLRISTLPSTAFHYHVPTQLHRFTMYMMLFKHPFFMCCGIILHLQQVPAVIVYKCQEKRILALENISSGDCCRCITPRIRPMWRCAGGLRNTLVSATRCWRLPGHVVRAKGILAIMILQGLVDREISRGKPARRCKGIDNAELE